MVMTCFASLPKLQKQFKTAFSGLLSIRCLTLIDLLHPLTLFPLCHQAVNGEYCERSSLRKKELEILKNVQIGSVEQGS